MEKRFRFSSAGDEGHTCLDRALVISVAAAIPAVVIAQAVAEVLDSAASYPSQVEIAIAVPIAALVSALAVGWTSKKNRTKRLHFPPGAAASRGASCPASGRAGRFIPPHEEDRP